ncbi:MAG TPA: outer membrane beta-barrel protein, partial [Burkholderiaceae bacterium]|nr:outer membrane beta-barrel protein [Burkholderiaceae bacterium]
MLDRHVLAACCVAALPFAAHAQMSYPAGQYFDDRWYVTPFGAYVFPDNNRQAENGWGGGLAVGKPITPQWNVELRGMYERLDNKGSGAGQYKNWSGEVDAQWFFMGRQGINVWQQNSVQPYLVGGIGAINDKVSGARIDVAKKTSFMGTLGAGIVWPFADWGRLVIDGRYRYDANHGNLGRQGNHFDEGLITVGLQIPFGPKPMVAAPPPPPPPPRAVVPPPPPPPPPP